MLKSSNLVITIKKIKYPGNFAGYIRIGGA